MTRQRYIALLRGEPRSAVDTVARLPEDMLAYEGLTTVIDTAAMMLAVAGPTPIALGNGGIIIGTLFRRDTMRRVSHLSLQAEAAITTLGARHLIDEYWGAYVAFLPQPNEGMLVLRAPLGELPCLVNQNGGTCLIMSEIDLACRTGLYRPQIDWEQLRHFLATRDLRSAQTCLVGVHEIPGGHAMALTGAQHPADTPPPSEIVWSPAPFASPQWRVTDRDEAVQLVSTAARACVTARAEPFKKVLLMLSGGLDSSIVAACLAETGKSVEALNLVTRDPIGDERTYARRAANWLGIPLHEKLRNVARIDVTRSAAGRLARPGTRLFLQESVRLSESLAVRTGCEAIFNGGGGDNVFCSLQSASPAADRLLACGPGAGFLDTAVEISRLAPAALGSVIVDSVRRAWFGKRALRFVRDFSMMPGDTGNHVADHDDHPWLAFPPATLPGTAAHVRLIAYAQNYVEGFDPADPIPTIAPLMAQPLVETCLRIPTWLWLENGRNRAIARHGFSGSLPSDILARRSKGTPDSFAAEIFEIHKPAIRKFLAEGMLATRGLIDRDAVLAVLDDPRPAQTELFRRILQLVDVEAWVQVWLAKGLAGIQEPVRHVHH